MEMSKEQIKNFRSVLVNMIGSYALLMSDDDVIKMRDRMQSQLNNREGERENG